MKKKLIIVFLLQSILSLSANNDLFFSLDSKYRTNSIEENNDKFGYDFTKMFDNNEETCMAINNRELQLNQGLFLSLNGVNHSNPKISGFSIKPGFFDDRFYSKNSRIKKLELLLQVHSKDHRGYSHYNDIIYEYEFDDKMEEKIIRFPQVINGNITKFEIKILETYEGSHWNDICISEFHFINNEENINIQICANPYSRITWYLSNNKVLGGEFHSDHDQGLLFTDYNENRINKIDLFTNDFETNVPSLYKTYEYVYSENLISVIEHNHFRNNQNTIRTYHFNDNELTQENIFDQGQIIITFDFPSGLNDSDSIRNYFYNDKYISRIQQESIDVNSLNYSETNFFDTNGSIYQTYRSSYWNYLLPLELLLMSN